MKKILLINNGSHVGIACVGDAYKKAFEFLGIEFTYLDLFRYPSIHNMEANSLVKSQLSGSNYDIVIMIQPTYLYASTYGYLTSMQNRTKFYSIQTEDPYSVEAMLQMNGLFTKLFTNEKMCAKKFEKQRFVYLPVAFDSFKQYKHYTEKEYDFCSICTYYGDRMNAVNRLKEYAGSKIVGGNVSWLAMNNLSVDMSIFTLPVGFVPKHKELEIYSKSRFVINLHRPPEIIGKSDFTVPGKNCNCIVHEAISPNPRFFDAIACGAFPINDMCRTECSEIFKKYFINFFDVEIVLKDYELIMVYWDYYKNVLDYMSKLFRQNETYLARAKVLLEEINYEG